MVTDDVKQKAMVDVNSRPTTWSVDCQQTSANSTNAKDSSTVADLNMLNATKKKRNITKNVLLISTAFLLNFTAFQGLSRLQNSLHRIEGMGVLTSSCLYGSIVLSCMFVPKLVIAAIGHRWTIALSFIGYILWMAANGYAVWGTMITSSILVGICAAPLWTAQCSYFTIVAGRYAQLTGEDEQAVVTRFFGIFFMFFQLSSVTGSIIISTVLKPPVTNHNDSFDLSQCGANDCPWFDLGVVDARPDSVTVWTMLGIFMGLACCALLLVVFFVDNLPSELVDKKANVKKEILTNLVATFKHMRHIDQLLLIPLTMYSGFEQAAYNAEWTRSFITCGFGLWKIGLVTISFGVVNVIVSFTFGYIVKYIGRMPVFFTGMCVDICIQFTLMFWIPNTDQEYVLYILSGLWGLTDGIWQTQINALYGCLFSSDAEAAFSNYRLWESTGFIIAFAYSNFICTNAKLYVLTSVLGVGMLGYVLVDLRHRKIQEK